MGPLPVLFANVTNESCEGEGVGYGACVDLTCAAVFLVVVIGIGCYVCVPNREQHSEQRQELHSRFLEEASSCSCSECSVECCVQKEEEEEKAGEGEGGSLSPLPSYREVMEGGG